MGLVYLEVATAGELRSVEVGTGTVLETTELQAAVRVESGAVVEPGHLVRFEIPERRLVGPEIEPSGTSLPSRRFPESFVSNDAAPCLNVRPFPARFAHPVDCLSPGTSVEITDQTTGWSRIRLPDGTVGWVAHSFLSAAGTAAQPRSREPAALRPLEIENMKRRLDAAEAALEASETARSDLERRLAEATAAAEARPAAAPEVSALEAQLVQSAQSLERLRSYRLRLHKAVAEAESTRDVVVEELVEEVMIDLEGELRETAAELESTARERDDLRTRVEAAEAEIASLRQQLEETTSSRPAAVEEAEARRVEAEARATELEVRLERAESLIAELEQRLQEGETASPERIPSVPGPLTSEELPSRAEQDTHSEPVGAAPAVDQPGLDREGDSDSGPAAEIGSSATHIENVAWTLEDDTLVVTLTMDGKVSKSDCQVVRVRSGAPRDVLKIRGVRKALSPPTIEIGVGNVRRLRSGLHWRNGTSEVHLVADLERPEAGIRKVTIRGNVLVITIS
jgi:SH3-like domain-containing protein